MSFDDLENLATVAAAAAATAAAASSNAAPSVTDSSSHQRSNSAPLQAPSAPLMPSMKPIDGESHLPSSPIYDSDAQENESPSKFPPHFPHHLQQQQQRAWSVEAASQRHSLGGVGGIPSGPGGYVVNKSGHLTKDGGFRKLHRCKYCPYTNVRKVNLQLHEKMHGRNTAMDGKDLIQCPYCDYTVGNKGLLSHHLKVHMEKSNIYDDADPSILPIDQISSSATAAAADSKFYFDSMTSAGMTSASSAVSQRAVFPDGNNFPSDDDSSEEARPSSAEEGGGGGGDGSGGGGGRGGGYPHPSSHPSSTAVADHHVPRFFCIRCPYSTENHIHYQRHLEMHGSQQKFACSHCDYSVGTLAQLEHHRRLHDTASSASAGEEAASTSGYATSSSGFSSHDDNYRNVDGGGSGGGEAHSPTSPKLDRNHEEYFARPISIHSSSSFPSSSASVREEALPSSPDDDQIDSFHHRIDDGIQSYKCSLCPYIDTRRDVLFAHLKCHSTPSVFTCRVCGFGVTKQHLLSQHLKVHSESYANAVANNMNNVVVLSAEDELTTSAGSMIRPGAGATMRLHPSPIITNASHSSSSFPSFSSSSSVKSAAFPAPPPTAVNFPAEDRSAATAATDGPMDLSAKPKSLLLPPSSSDFDDDGSKWSSSVAATATEGKGNRYSLYSRMSAVPIKDSIKELRNFARNSSSVKETATTVSGESYASATSASPDPPGAPAAMTSSREFGAAAMFTPRQQQHPQQQHRVVAKPASVTASQLEFAREHLVRAATALAASHAAASTSEILQSRRNAAFKDASLSLAQAALVSRQHPALALGEAEGEESDGDTMWVCQFCDVGFTASSKLVQHEMEHLMGKIKS